MNNQSGTSRFLRWVLLPVALFAACTNGEVTSPAQGGSSGSAGARQDASGGSAGASGSSGSTGSSGRGGSSGSSGSAGTSATGGTAGTAGREGGPADIRSPRRCGHGVACSAGAECSASGIESGLDCKCDSSGHYFCDAWAGAGAGGQADCPRRTGCSGSGGSGGTDDGSCSRTNGYCTRTCVCPGGACTTDCSGTGPAASEGALCDATYCDDPYNRYGGSCSVKDGSCDYGVHCDSLTPPMITGRCD